MDFKEIATGLGLAGVQGIIRGEQMDRQQQGQQQQQQQQQNELQRRESLITQRQQTIEAIKQRGLNRRKEIEINGKTAKDAHEIIGRDENGFPIYKNNIADYKANGGILYDKGVKRDDGTGGTGSGGFSQKDLMKFDKELNTAYSTYLEDFLGDPGTELSKETYAKENLKYHHEALYSGGIASTGADPGSGTGQETDAAFMVYKLLGKSGKTFSKSGANPKKEQFEMVSSHDSTIVPLEPGGSEGDVIQPAPMNYDMPTAEDNTGEEGGRILSNILNGSFDLSDIFKGIVKGTKAGGEFIGDRHDANMAALPQAKEEMITAAEEAAKVQGWTEEQFQIVTSKIAEGTIEAIQWVIDVMRAPTKQRDAYFAKL